MQWALVPSFPALSTHRSKVRVSTGRSVRSGLSTGNIWHFGSLAMNLPSRRTVVYHLTEKKKKKEAASFPSFAADHLRGFVNPPHSSFSFHFKTFLKSIVTRCPIFLSKGCHRSSFLENAKLSFHSIQQTRLKADWVARTRGAEAKDITHYCIYLWHFRSWCFLTNVLESTGQFCHDANPLRTQRGWTEPKDGQLCSEPPSLCIPVCSTNTVGIFWVLSWEKG